MKIVAARLIPALIGIATKKSWSISTAPSSSTIATDATAALAEDLVGQVIDPAKPLTIAEPAAAHDLPNAVKADPAPPIATSNAMLAKEAAAAGIPVVPPLRPTTAAELAGATEGHESWWRSIVLWLARIFA
jgi:hypothetical protein